MYNSIYELLPFLSSTHIDKIVFTLLIIISYYIFNSLLREKIKLYLKIYLYIHRKDYYYRLMFKRYDKLVKPIILSINILFLKLLITVFITNNVVNSVFELIHLFILLLFVYEVIKFFLYGLLLIKIKNEKSARKELYNLFLNITKIVIVILSFLIFLIQVGVDITALIASLGIGGAIIALSAKDTLTNFFDSIRLISSDAFRQGDWIQTKYTEGFVTEVGLTTTKVRTFSNAFVSIPNSKLANDYIENWSKRWVGRKIKFHIRLKIKNDKQELDNVIKQISFMLNNHDDIVNDKKLAHLIKTNKTYEDSLFNTADKYGVRKTMLVYLDEIDVYSMNILVYVFSISVEWQDWLHTKQDVLKEVINIIDNSTLEFAYPKEEILLESKKDDVEII